MMNAIKLVITLWIFSWYSTALSQNMEIYVSDAGNFNSPPWQILKFDENGENPEVFINTNLAWPQDILFLEDQGVVLISNLSSNKITKHNITDGNYIDDFATGISGPTRMKIGPDSLLYVLQWSGNGKVKRYELDGTFVDDFTSIGVPQSIGIEWDSDGNLYVSSYNGDSVRKFDSNGNDLGLFINANLLGPTNIWFDDSGDLLVADYNAGIVKRFDSSGSFDSNFIPGLSSVEGVDFFPNGNILLGNGGSSSVKMYDNLGNYIEDFIPTGSGGLMTPNAVIIRQITPLSIEKPQTVANFIRPTIGWDFYLKSDATHSIKSIEVYNTLGTLVFKSPLERNRVWDAYGHTPGLYFIVAQHIDGSFFTQKVMVE